MRMMRDACPGDRPSLHEASHGRQVFPAVKEADPSSHPDSLCSSNNRQWFQELFKIPLASGYFIGYRGLTWGDMQMPRLTECGMA